MNSILKRALLLSLLALLGMATTAQAASDDLITEHIPIHLTAPGTLSSRIGSNKKLLITDLSVSGAMNIRDVQFLREMAGCLDDKWQPTGGHLQHLDLSAASLVAGEDEIRVNLNVVFNMNMYTQVRIDNGKRISRNLFRALSSLQSIILPEGITEIGSMSFLCCTALTSVTFPSTLTSIGDEAFQSCTALTEVSLPSQVQTIGSRAFSKCTSLRTLTARQGLRVIDEFAFEGCTALAALNLSSGLRHIENYAFMSCTALQGVSLPTGLKYVGCQAFSGCTALEWVSGYMAADTIDSYAFDECPSLRSVGLSQGSTKYIGYNAFAQCKALREVNLPSTLRLIAGEAFLGCDSIESLTLPASLDSIGEMAFRHCRGLKSLRFLSSNVRMGKHAFAECISLESVTLPEHQTAINKYCFNSCEALKSINLPYGLTSIDDGAFSGCSNLTSVPLPNTLDSIGSRAFWLCYSLPSLTLPSSVRSIGAYAFSDCDKLTSVRCYAPAPPTIGSNAFPRGTYSNTTLYVPQGTRLDYFLLDEWGNFGEVREFDPTRDTVRTESAGTLYQLVDPYWKYRMTDLSVSGPLDITDIQHIREMAGCYKADGTKHDGQLTSLDLSDAQLVSSQLTQEVYFRNLGSRTAQITSDGPQALFAYLEDLQRVTLPGNLTSIGESTFRWCQSLDSVALPGKLRNIGDYAFERCGQLGRIKLPNSLTSIGASAFRSCGKLATLNLPDGLQSLGSLALGDCGGLQEIYTYQPAPASAGEDTFSGISSDCTLFVPQGAIDQYRKATGWSSIGHIVEIGPVTVAVKRAGTLASLIDPAQKYKTTMLTVTGLLNSNDIQYIREMAGCYKADGTRHAGHLQNLDIRNTRLVAGGEKVPVYNSSGNSVLTATIGSNGSHTALFACLDKLQTVVFSDKATSVGDFTFEGCTSLTSVQLPSSVTSIGERAFSGCRSLTEAPIPSGVTDIGEYAFSECRGLKKLTLPAGIRQISNGAFSYCGFTWVHFPTGLQVIGYGAFASCEHLQSVVLPASLAELDECAFSCCWNLASVYMRNPEPPFLGNGGGHFKGVSDECILYVPKGSLDAYRGSELAFYFRDIQEFDATGITTQPGTTGTSEVSRHSISGLRQDSHAQGISIVRYSDGTVRKVVGK